MEYEALQNTVAELIGGTVVDDTDRVAVCIKGTVNGFPCQLEAFMANWPFSVTYVVQTKPTDEISAQNEEEMDDQAKITLLPRVGQGFLSFFAHAFLFESRGMTVHDKKLERKFIFTYDNKDPALRMIKYPGIPEILITMEEDCKLKELVIKTNGGLYLVQGTSFQNLDPDLCQATFNYMGQIAQVLSELF
jgi:hypothetical protein